MPTIENIFLPGRKDFDRLKAYLTITMKSLDSKSVGFSKLGNLFTGYIQTLGDFGKSSIQALLKDKEKNLNKAISGFKKRIDKVKTSSTNLGLKGDDIFIFNTYVPNDFALNLVGDWQTQELLSTGKAFEGLVKTALGSIPAVGDLLRSQYNVLKNQMQFYNNIGLSPLEVKLFQPSFLETGLNFEFQPNNSKESENLIKLLNVLKQAVIPKSRDGEWYEYLALFDIELVVPENNRTNTESISNKKNKTIELFTIFKDLGMTNLNVTPMTGNNLNSAFRTDGSLHGAKISMSFTSVKKIYDEKETVSQRVDNILKG